ncbi:MAG TPA: hypothetical protein VG028_07485 [Terriglobia bacterium]|nr:hypothetical protein [Terriglobia bacterium]
MQGIEQAAHVGPQGIVVLVEETWALGFEPALQWAAGGQQRFDDVVAQDDERVATVSEFLTVGFFYPRYDSGRWT